MKRESYPVVYSQEQANYGHEYPYTVSTPLVNRIEERPKSPQKKDLKDTAKKVGIIGSAAGAALLTSYGLGKRKGKKVAQKEYEAYLQEVLNQNKKKRRIPGFFDWIKRRRGKQASIFMEENVDYSYSQPTNDKRPLKFQDSYQKSMEDAIGTYESSAVKKALQMASDEGAGPEVIQRIKQVRDYDRAFEYLRKGTYEI